jgi:Smg protein
MNQNIFEIISQLVRRLLYDGDVIRDEERLINSLRDEGYDLDEINQAFEFIFSSSEIIDLPEKEQKRNKVKVNKFRQRVLDFRERFKFSLEVQGIIIKLNTLNLIKEEELERIIARSLVEQNKVIGITEFWDILEEVIDNDLRLLAITNQINEFQEIIDTEDKYLN